MTSPARITELGGIGHDDTRFRLVYWMNPLTTYTRDNLPELLRASPQLSVESPSEGLTSQTVLATGQKESGSSEPKFFDQINLDEALRLYSVVRSLNPTDTMEIGFCCGGSGLAILQALEDAKNGVHHAIDPYQTSYAKGQGLRNVQAAGLKHRLELFESFPEDVIGKVPSVQFAFIDASHLFDLSMLDFVLADKRLEEGGVIAFHDLWMPSLQKLVRYILANRHYEVLAHDSLQKNETKSFRFLAAKAWSKWISHSTFLQKLLAPECVRPWRIYQASNIMFLRKLKHDDRDWRFHKRF